MTEHTFTPPLADPDPLLAGVAFAYPGPVGGTAWLCETTSDDQLLLLKALPGVRYLNKTKTHAAGWALPTSVVEAGYYPPTLWGQTVDGEVYTPRPSSRVLHLRDDQRRAVSFIRAAIADHREGCILAADMGTGKTICALQALHREGLLNLPGLVVGPKIARSTWTGEASDPLLSYGLPIVPLEGVKDIDVGVLTRHTHFFAHYDVLANWAPSISMYLKPAWIVFDEVHLCANPRAKRSKAAFSLSAMSTVYARIGLTGTPIPNDWMDLWGQLHIVQPQQWENHPHKFGMRYMGGHIEMRSDKEPDDDDAGYYVYDAPTNEVELRRRLAGTFLRYVAEEVPNGLPALTHTPVYVDLDAEALAEYRKASPDVLGYISQRQQTEVGAVSVDGVPIIDRKAVRTGERGAVSAEVRAITELVNLISMAKAKYAAPYLEQTLDKHDKIVVFSSRIKTAEYLYEQLKLYVDDTLVLGPVDGKMSHKQRVAFADVFWSHPGQAVYVATLGSAGMSLNPLAAASCVAFVDLHWNPSTINQAKTRVRRSNCPHREVEALFFVARGTIDEKLMESLLTKAYAAEHLASNDTDASRMMADLLPSPQPGDPSGGFGDLLSILPALLGEELD